VHKKTAKRINKLWKTAPWLLAIFLIGVCIYKFVIQPVMEAKETVPQGSSYADVNHVPAYSSEPYVVIGDGTPGFTETNYTTSFETYAPLDDLGRCGVAYACIGLDLMPTASREDISSVKPTGWINHPYDFVDGEFVYNRCHLIGFQLSGENANERNLITGTRYMNTQGMLPFENMIAHYVKETGNHVLYRVTPVFYGEELVCRGVQMEAYSVEDNGAGVFFNVYAYNVQPGVIIDYETGENRREVPENSDLSRNTYILNASSGKFHKEDCTQGQGVSEKNKKIMTATREEMLKYGYTSAGCCNP